MCFGRCSTAHIQELIFQVVMMNLLEHVLRVSFHVCQHRVSWHVCQHLLPLKARLSQDHVFVVCSVVVSWSLSGHHGLPCSGSGVPWMSFAGTHQCATESRVTPWQSANPCCVLSWPRVCLALVLVIVHHAHVQLRILTLRTNLEAAVEVSRET